jgi:phosphotransferase system enzyme I (PtsP)
MGWRGIRISLECRDIFRDQLAAIMMASVNRNARIMLPMISGVDEIIQAREVFDEALSELRASGIPFNDRMPLGIMIETPAAVQTAAILAKKADFFSIGTNDLIQYTLAADRNNPKIKSYYTPYHPALLHSIKAVADAGRDAGIPVSLCGEMAVDPLNALLIAGLGITDLSMSSPSIPKAKQAILGATCKAATNMASEILKLESSVEIACFLKESGLELGIVS